MGTGFCKALFLTRAGFCFPGNIQHLTWPAPPTSALPPMKASPTDSKMLMMTAALSWKYTSVTGMSFPERQHIQLQSLCYLLLAGKTEVQTVPAEKGSLSNKIRAHMCLFTTFSFAVCRVLKEACIRGLFYGTWRPNALGSPHFAIVRCTGN